MTYDEQVQVIARRCPAPVTLQHDGADWWTSEGGGRVGGGPTLRLAANSLFIRVHGMSASRWALEQGDAELAEAIEGLDEEGAEYGKDPQAD